MHFLRIFFVPLFLSIPFLITSHFSFALNEVDDGRNQVLSQNMSNGHFSNTKIALEKSSKKYYQDAIIDFTTKLNTAIHGHTVLRSLSESCGGCDVIKLDFDEYLKNHLPQKDYGAVITQFFNSKVSRNITSQQQKSLNDLIAGMLTFIIEDANYLIQTQEDMNSIGKYSDGDVNNSPYDLIDDMKKIWGIFFKDTTEYDGFVNTMDNDASGLITGRFEVGNWANGKNYEIDLASDVAGAFGQNTDSGTSSKDDGDDCEDGFCMTLEMMDNNQSSAHRGGTAFIDKNMEEIFGSALDWLIQKGDKRNLACKGPPPVNQYQSNNDDNLSFKNIFRGLGIYVFQKTPQYAVPKDGTNKNETLEDKKRNMDDAIASSFKSRNIDPDNLLLFTQKQLIEEATPVGSTPANAVANQRIATREYYKQQNIKSDSQRSAENRERGNTYAGDKNMIRSFASGIDSFHTMIRDMLDISKTLKDKPNCEN